MIKIELKAEQLQNFYNTVSVLTNRYAQQHGLMAHEQATFADLLEVGEGPLSQAHIMFLLYLLTTMRVDVQHSRALRDLWCLVFDESEGNNAVSKPEDE